jgi:hypothetical protein
MLVVQGTRMGLWIPMKYFTQIECPLFNLRDEMDAMLEAGEIKWHQLDQICLNTTADAPDDMNRGIGSLRWDWSKSYFDEDQQKVVAPQRQSPGLREWHFDTLCTQFKGTEFEKAYNFIAEKYKVGRVRLMKSQSRTCLSWHTDSTDRIHYPLKTQEGCYMVIEDEVHFMPEDTLWHTQTKYKHTAFNASMEDRIHLVAAILD